MSVTRALHRNSVFFFILLPVFAVWGFWPTYFAQAIRPITIIDHAHGIAMFGWCAMLIAQAWLIRSRRRNVHRALGTFSYVLVPIIAISTLMLANQQINARGLTFQGLYILMLQISILPQFLIFYALAIRNRKRSDVHARWMVCTALPMIDPIFARIFLFNVLSPEQAPMAQVFTYLMTDLVAIALLTWDWRREQRRDVFLPALIVLVILQLPTFTLVGSAGWAAFAEWFAGLALS
jgi:hypothetical protein